MSRLPPLPLLAARHSSRRSKAEMLVELKTP
jgi:hypothetical protein